MGSSSSFAGLFSFSVGAPEGASPLALDEAIRVAPVADVSVELRPVEREFVRANKVYGLAQVIWKVFRMSIEECDKTLLCAGTPVLRLPHATHAVAQIGADRPFGVQSIKAGNE
jgi:hypothetical protein